MSELVDQVSELVHRMCEQVDKVTEKVYEVSEQVEKVRSLHKDKVRI